jgi:hypothetical protein
MSHTIAEGTVVSKIKSLIGHLRYLHFPSFENMRGYEMVGFVPKITQVEIKFVETTGKEEIIIFNQKELENIKEMKNLKNELLKLEESKKELNRKINNARNELTFIEFTEVTD